MKLSKRQQWATAENKDAKTGRACHRQHKSPSLSHLTWFFFFFFVTYSLSLALSVSPFLARSACKSMLWFGSHTLELSAALSRPKAIWGQRSEREGRERQRQREVGTGGWGRVMEPIEDAEKGRMGSISSSPLKSSLIVWFVIVAFSSGSPPAQSTTTKGPDCLPAATNTFLKASLCYLLSSFRIFLRQIYIRVKGMG